MNSRIQRQECASSMRLRTVTLQKRRWSRSNVSRQSRERHSPAASYSERRTGTVVLYVVCSGILLCVRRMTDDVRVLLSRIPAKDLAIQKGNYHSSSLINGFAKANPCLHSACNMDKKLKSKNCDHQIQNYYTMIDTSYSM